MPPIRKTLGETIREARLKLDITLREFARRLGLAPSYISDVETDRRVPSEEVLKKMARILRLDVHELLARAGRVSEEAERFLRRNPEAGVLFRRLPQMTSQEVQDLIDQVRKHRGSG